MVDTILFALWFFIPAGIANMTPVPVAKLPGLRNLSAPLDFGATIGGQRIFGAHKTWRGLVAGIAAATLTVWAQQWLVREYGWFVASAADEGYLSLNGWLLGPALAVGALGGDAVKSFFKRRRNIVPGSVWLPYDLIDHIIGAAILALPFVFFAWWVYPVVVVLWLFANLGISYAAYLAHIKERPF
ncbi:MAG TPA: CDP-archaeol synthase [Candidatus Saccharimonadales bacterium]|nr:CDP-archaeol synthase [Candidatus Saccharimonadales bacterium]